MKPNNNGGSSAGVQIIVALIGAAALVLAAWIGVQYGESRGGQQGNTLPPTGEEAPIPVRTVVASPPTIASPVPCQAIIGKLPDNPEEVRRMFGLPSDKGIRVFYEICQEASNGFIVEESPSTFTLQVPTGGCIDSYSGAEFTEATEPDRTGGGRRVYSGSVTTTSLTYRIAGCELKP